MPIAPQDFEYICELIRRRAGITLEPGKEYLVESRLVPLAKQEGLKGIEDLLAKMKTGPLAMSLTRKVIESMTTNETSFFRDIHPFDALRDKVIPDLIARRAMTKTLSIWCAAASSGQEPYTILMLLRENFPQLFNGGWRFQFVGTDLSSEMIRRCREGKFSQLEINRGLPAQLMVKYFKKIGMDWQIDEQLRKACEFREMNLCDEWTGLSNIDIVFMRNVLIYFSVETKRQILGKVRKVMKPDGYLFLGGAETTINIDESYDRLQIQRSGIYQVKAAA